MKLRYPLMFGCAVMGLMALSLPMMMGGLEGLAPLVLVAMAWAGVVLGVRLRPSLAGVVSERRPPSASEGAALAVGLIGALMSFSTIAVGAGFVLDLLDARGLGIEAVCGPVFQLVWLALPIAPLWARILAGADAADEPLRPLGTALLGGGPLGLAFGVLWLSAVDPMTRTIVPTEAPLNAILLAPMWMLMMTFGVASVVPAFRRQPEEGEVFRLSVDAAIVGWTVAVVALSLGVAGLLGGTWSARITTIGGMWAAGYGAAAALAWVAALFRIRRLPVEGAVTVPAALAVLALSFPVTLWASAAMANTQWADFVGVVVFPFALATDVAVLFAAPALVGLLAQRRQQPAFVRSAGLS